MVSRAVIFYLVFIFLICGTSPVWSAETYTSWFYKVYIRLNTAPAGAGIPDKVFNFPVLIRLNADNFDFSQAKTNGEDIRFTKSDNSTILKYEIENWNKLGKTAEIWVGVDTVYGNNDAQYFVMYWGKNDASSESNGAEVFATARGFDGVWHFPPGTAPADTFRDATGNNHGTNQGSTFLNNGAIGHARNFDNTVQWIEISSPAADFKYTTTATFSAWIRSGVSNLYGNVFARQYGTRSADVFNFGVHDKTYMGPNWDNRAGTITNGEWVHLAAVKNAAVESLYVNGTFLAEFTNQANWTPDDNEVTIGCQYNGSSGPPSECFEGEIDELRSSGVVRSADWIKLSFENQRQNQSLVSIDYNITNTIPVVGWTEGESPPAIRAEQLRDGTGWVSVSFKVQDEQADSILLTEFQYSLDNGETWITEPNTSQALESGWNLRNYASHTDISLAPAHKFHFKTAISEGGGFTEKDNHRVMVRFIFTEKGLNPSHTAISKVFRVDNKAPVIIFEEIVTSDQSPLLSGAIEEKVDSVLIEIGGKSYSTKLAPDSRHWTLPDNSLAQLAEGTHEVKISAFDKNGNKSTAIFKKGIQIDLTAPEVTITPVSTFHLSPEISGTVSDNSATVEITIGDESHQAEVSPDGAWRVPAGAFKNLQRGIYIIKAAAKLQSGLTGNATAELTISGKPAIKVYKLESSSQSPALSGWVSDTSALVYITIGNTVNGNETHKAAIGSDSIWRIQAGTFQALADGTYDVMAKAVNSVGETFDTTNNELIIRTKPPVVKVEDIITNKANPTLSGTVDLASAEIRVEFLKKEGNSYKVLQKHTANNQGNGEWKLDGATIQSLPEGVLMAAVTATDNLNLKGLDTAKVIIDLTNPKVKNISPSNNSIATKDATLSITFSETVFPDQGSVELKESGSDNIAQSFPVGNGKTKRIGPSTFEFLLDSDLKAGSKYYVQIGKKAFKDTVGNYYAGITDKKSWTFQVAENKHPSIDSVTSLTPDGLYGIGKKIEIKLHFSEAIELTGGKLIASLATGEEPGKLEIKPFESAHSAVGSYTVRKGDGTDALTLLSGLTLDKDASASAVKTGMSLLLTIGKDKNLSDYSKIRLDGYPPVIKDVKPVSQQILLSPEVLYNLEEEVKSAKLSWQNCKTDKGKCKNLDYTLKGDLLQPGKHTVVMNKDKLTSGATYTVSLTASDSAGNTNTIVSDLVKLFSSIVKLKSTPGDTSCEVGSKWKFSATGLSSPDAKTGVDLNNASWSANGPCTVGEDGQFEAHGLGLCEVACRFKAPNSKTLNSKTMVEINKAAIPFPEKGGKVVQLGKGIEITLPKIPKTKEPTFLIKQLQKDAYPKGLKPVGPALVFKPKSKEIPWIFEKPSTIRLQLTDTTLTEKNRAQVRIYKTLPDKKGQWFRLPSKLKKSWIEAKTDTLGSFIAAIDTLAPELSDLKVKRVISAGKSMDISFEVRDNIANPASRVRIYRGGTSKESLIKAKADSEKPEIMHAAIPGDWATKAGLWYLIEADDGINQAKDTVDVRVAISKKLEPDDELKLKEGQYQMLSIPLKPDKNTLDELLVDDFGKPDNTKWRFYVYDSKFRKMETDDKILPGRAYWFRTKDFTPEIDIDKGTTYTLPVSRPHVIPLQSGWNCIANPFMFDIRPSDLHTQNGKPVDRLWEHIKGEKWLTKKDIKALTPWRGYLIWNGKKADSDSLRIYPRTHTASAKTTAKSGGVRISVTVTDGTFEDGITVIGFGAAGADNGLDSWDYLKPGLFSKPLDLSIRTLWDGDRPYLTDIRKDLGEGRKWRFSLSLGKEAKLPSLSFTNLDKLPKGSDAVLMDYTSGRALPLKSGALPYPGGKGKAVNTFEIAIGSPAYLSGQQALFEKKTARFEFIGISPNPFWRQTVIRYAVPWNNGQDSHVRIQIFDIRGRLVCELEDKYLKGGRYTATWNGMAAGKQVPSRVYYCRLTVDKQRAFKKIVVLR